MANPTSRAEFKANCLRRLGAPVIEVNVDDDQIDDRIDEALAYFWDYHFDGSERIFYKHIITQDDITNKYITLPENIIGAVRIFNIGDMISQSSLFDVRYQIALNDLYQFYRQSMVPYYMNLMQIQFLEQLLVGQQPIRYSKHRDRLHVDMDWGRVNEGNYLVVEAYEVIDPDTFTDAWKDRWLLRYTTALIKRQWGINLTKYSGVQLIGGITFNGDKIHREAVEEIEKLEAEMLTSYSLPPSYMVG